MGAAATIGFVVACQSLVGIEDSPPLPAAGGSAGTGGSGGAGGSADGGGSGGSGGEADSGCHSAQPPPPPTSGGPGANVELVFAVRQLDLGDRNDANGPTWKQIGYDLDKLCTCSVDTAGSCKSPKETVCDGLEGRDNSLGAFLHQMRNVFKITDASSEQLSTKIEGGTNTILIRVRNYNGEANDSQVEVAWFASADFDDTNPAPPKWDGNDPWPVLTTSLQPQTAADGGTTYDVEHAKYVDKLGYVSNGTLSASLPAGVFALTTDQSINFTAAFFTAKLQKTGTTWDMENGVLAGITAVGEVLGVLAAVDDPVTNKPLCTDNLLYAGVKQIVCDFPDMSVLGTPTKPCDHFSLGIKMSGTAAKLGPVWTNVFKPSPCAPGKDPKDDGC